MFAASILITALFASDVGRGHLSFPKIKSVFKPVHHTKPLLPIHFPKKFRFGFATVAYQSEGTMRSDSSRVRSNWSQWEDLGKIEGRQHNDHGNGFFDGYPVEFERAADLGATAFSYAIDWSRLEPKRGKFDDNERDRIVNIVKEMRKHGLHPLIVLFHWVTPAWVQSPFTGVDMLSAPNQDFVDAFLELEDYIVPALSGLVDEWVTFEEPYSIIAGEYLTGLMPPGKVYDFDAAKKVFVNLLYLHARSYHRLKALDTIDADGDGIAANIGWENGAYPTVPLDPTNPADVDAAKRLDYLLNHQFLTGIIKGDVDPEGEGDRAENHSIWHDSSLANTLDWIGLNYYNPVPVKASNETPWGAIPILDVRQYDVNRPHSDLYQEIDAHGLRSVIEEYSAYGLPIVITENGLADADDDQRPHYLVDHLQTVAQAIADGYDVRGYYCWTISDNFEWQLGTKARFGVFSVDYSKPGFPRTRTRSAEIFKDIATKRLISRKLWYSVASSRYPVGVLP